MNASLTAWFAIKQLLHDLSARTEVVEQRYLEATERADNVLMQACDSLMALKSRLEGYEKCSDRLIGYSIRCFQIRRTQCGICCKGVAH